MIRSMKDSEDEAEQKTGRMRSQKFNISSIVNSPLRRSSRIKQSKNSPPSSESDTSSISSYQPTRNRSRRATMDNTDSEKLKPGRPRKFSISPDDNESIDIDIIGTPKKRTTRSSLAAVTDTPTKINTRAASKRLMRAGSETKSPLLAVRSTRRTRASSVDPESLSDQNRSQPGTPVKTHKQVLSNSPIKKEDEKKNRIPYVRLDATIVETDELTNSGNSDSSPDKTLHSQQSPRTTKHQNIHKDEEDNNDKITSLVVSPTSPRNVSSTHSESDEILELSEKEDDTHDKHIDKITMDNETIPDGECKDKEDLLSNKDTTDEILTEDNFSNLRDKKEHKLEIIKKSPSEMEKLLDNVCKQSATKELIIKIGKLSNTSIEEQKGNPSNKENQTLNIINDVSIENNTQPLTNVASPSTKCPSPMCANKSSSEQETKFTKNESSLNKRRHSRESIETAMKHDILSKKVIDSIEEKIDISTDSSIPDSTHKRKYLSSPSVNDTTKRQSLVCEADSKSTTKDTNESVLSQHEDVEIVDEVIVKDKTPAKQISKSTEMEEVTNDKVDKMEYFDHSGDSPTGVVSSVNKDFNDHSSMAKKQLVTTQDNINVITDFIEQRNVSKRTESVPESSNTALETLNSASNESNEDNSVIQNTQPFNATETFEYVTSISSKRAERIRKLMENSRKQNLKQKSTDNIYDDHIEKKKENLQQENQKNTNTDPDDIVSINLLRDTSSDNSNKKIIEKKIDVETISMNSNSQLSKKSENESETECDLVLMNKKAWLAAEKMKAAKEAESSEYDSDDTVLLKSQLDAIRTNCDAKQMSTINEELLENQIVTMVRSDKTSLIEEEKMDSSNKAANSSIKERYVLKKCEDSFNSTEDEDDLEAAINKSLIEYKAIKNLNKSCDRSVSKLNKSGQTIAKTMEQSFKTRDESDEQVEDDANELNRSSQVNKKNTSLSKSMERRKSFNKSLTKDTPLKQGDKATQNISINKSRLDHSKKESDNTDKYSEKKLNKKYSLSKLQNKDESASEPEEQSSPKPVNIKTSTYLNDNESDDSEIVISVMDFGCKSYSTTACMGSTPDKMSDSSDEDESRIPKLVMTNSDSEASTSIHSDIKREYNLDGAKQKFSDDNVPGDECRASESEVSDPDDDGSDLADFIVDDSEIEKEEDNDDDDNEEKEESNSEGENEQIIEEVRDAEEEEDEDAKEEETENAEEEEAEDAEEEEVDDESENEQNVKEKNKVAEKKKIKDSKKSNMMKNKTILLDTSNSDSSFKNKSMQKNEDSILLDTSSNLSAKKKAKKKEKLEVQCSSKDVTEQNLMEQLNKSQEAITKKCPKSRQNISLKCSTPKFDTFKKFEFYETPLEENSKIKDTKSDSTKTIQNTSPKKKELNIEADTSKLEEKKLAKLAVQNYLIESFEKFIHSRNASKTSETLEKNSEIKDTTSDSTKAKQNTSLKEKESKNKDSRKLSFMDLNKFVEIAIKLPYPINKTETTEKTGSSKSSSKEAELHKTMNVTHTESPTIKYLRKEKLHESAPELGVNKSKQEIDSNSDRSKKKLLSVKQTKDIAQAETKLESDEKEISNLVTPLNDEAVQKGKRKKQKKRKTPVENISDKNITDKVLIQDMMELDVPKKKKCIELAIGTIEEDDTCKDTCEINEKEKKQKKRQLKIIEQNEHVNEANVLQKNIRKNKTKLAQHKSENDEIVDGSELNVKKKTKWPKIAENKEIISEKLLKKKGEEKTSSLQIGTSKLKSDKNQASDKSQNIASDKIKSKNTAFAKAREEALEAIYATEMRLRAKKELKKKKREDDKNMIPEQVSKIPDKQKKQVVEKNDCLPSTSRVKRLSDDVIEDLMDQPMKAKKRKKLSHNEERIMSSEQSSKATTRKDVDFITLSSAGSTTQFAVVNLPKAQKLSLNKGSTAAASFRQRMLARNNREPVSAYMMYLEKQKASSNSRSSRNAF